MDDVKPILQVDVVETKFDVQLTSCVSSGSGLVDGFLKVKGLVVPVVVPELVKVAAVFFAAWMFRRFSDPVGAEAFWVEGQRFLDVYVDAEVVAYVGSA